MQQQTDRPAQFEITEQTRESLETWINQANLESDQYQFPNRIYNSPRLSNRQCTRVTEHWVTSIGLNPAACMEPILCDGQKQRLYIAGPRIYGLFNYCSEIRSL